MRTPTEIGGLMMAREQSESIKEDIEIRIGDEVFTYRRGALVVYYNARALESAKKEEREAHRG